MTNALLNTSPGVEPLRRRRMSGPGDGRPCPARQRPRRIHTHQEPVRPPRGRPHGARAHRTDYTLPSAQDRCREIFGGLFL